MVLSSISSEPVLYYITTNGNDCKSSLCAATPDRARVGHRFSLESVSSRDVSAGNSGRRRRPGILRAEPADGVDAVGRAIGRGQYGTWTVSPESVGRGDARGSSQVAASR